MAVVKPPRKAVSEKQTDAFISGKKVANEDSAEAKVITLRCAGDWLARVDEAAKKSGISRAAWLKFAASRLLDAEG